MNATLSPPPAWGAEPGQRDVWPTPRQELLLQAALLDDERAAAAWQDIRPDIDVAALDGGTTALLPTLRRNLLAHGIDDELLGLFKGVHRYAWARVQTLLAATVPVVQRLESAGIETMLLKGAAFIARGAVDAGQRLINDIDVLVPSARLSDAVSVLGECGFAPLGGPPPWYVTDYAPHFTPSYGFADSQDRQLDLHWHVMHGSCQPGADDDFWLAASETTLHGVRTRALAPTDDLLLVITHGLRWNAVPTYRWVLDAALLISGAYGPIDYERLVAQAVRRRLTVTLHAGLAYLARVLDLPVPAEVLRALGRGSRSRLERLEFRAQMTQPRLRSGLERTLIHHEQRLRRELALGHRAGVGRRLRVERARLGLRHPGDLRHLRWGGVPGPHRPTAETASPMGAGRPAHPRPLELDQPVRLQESEAVRGHVAYGTWRAESNGCWIAGREARLVLALRDPPRGRLALLLSADTHIADQQVRLVVNGHAAAPVGLEPQAGLRGHPVLLPRRAVRAGTTTLDVRVRCRHSSSPAERGEGDDDRLMGLLLQALAVTRPAAYRLGQPVTMTGEEQPVCRLLGGWWPAEPPGRWTRGRRSELWLRLEGSRPPVDLEFEATPFIGTGGPPLRVDVLAGGRRIGRLELGKGRPQRIRLSLPARAFEPAGDLVLGWKIANPRSPRDHGDSPDPRALGLMFTWLAIVPRS